MTTILLLSLLILLHELGHFVAAKIFGVKVEEFGIGIPPKALKLFTWRETEFTLNWLPIGGFVRLAGEEHDPSLWERINPFERKKMFFGKPAWQRMIVMLAGVAMNFVIGIVAFSTIYSILGVPKEQGSQVVVTKVMPGSPASLVDIAEGEAIVRVGNEEITKADQFVQLVGESKGRAVTMYLSKIDMNGQREGSEQVVTVVPRENPPEGEGALGVVVATAPILVYDKLPWYKAPVAGTVEGMKEAWGWSREFLRIFMHPAELVKNVGGPVKVVEVGQQAVAMGWIVTLRFVGIISLNLAIFNLLPFPALDGGRVLMLGVEKVAGKKRTAKIEGYVNAVGMGLLILMLVAVTIKDIWF